jgi:hypothetical protein
MRSVEKMRAGDLWSRFVAASLLALGGCSEAPEPVPFITPEPVTTTTVVQPAPSPQPVNAPGVPDPERAARARQEAARARFEREYPWHGVAYHFLAQVHATPDARSAVIGYMRRGAHFRAQPSVRGTGCARGFSRVPGDGYVCRGDGFALGEAPQSFEPSPVEASLDGALPYAYAWVARDNVPQYWHIPTREEEQQVEVWMRRQRTTETHAAPSPPAEAAAEVPVPEPEPEPDLEAPPGLDENAAEENAEAPPALDGGTAPDPAVREQPAALRMRMRHGFYVSIDRLETVEGRRFYRTIRGAYVPADSVSEATPPSMRGVVLGGRWHLPLAFVYRGGVRALARDSVRGALRLVAPVPRSTPLPLTDEIIERAGQRYRVSDRGRIVREDALRVARLRERPSSIPADARWIHVDLAQQMLVAYEGDRPVFATMVSTGRPGYETPTGTFRIQSKHVSTTMDDPNAGEDAYSIEDVPWTMYFHDSHALHGAFWHDRFGVPRSHGCVNLAPVDARWLFSWTGPTLPPGWHGISSGRGQGTWILIE